MPMGKKVNWTRTFEAADVQFNAFHDYRHEDYNNSLNNVRSSFVPKIDPQKMHKKR